MSGRLVRALLAPALAAVPWLAMHADAEERFRLLNAEKIRPRLIGHDLTDGVHWTWFYRPDGTLISVEMGKRRKGSWKIENNKLCSTNGRNRQLECYKVWASGQKISLRYFSDIPAIEGVAAPQPLSESSSLLRSRLRRTLKPQHWRSVR